MPIPPSLAGSWLKSGRIAITRSFRFHRPRGAFCHRGWCQQCKVRLPDGSITLACSASAGDKAHAPPPQERNWRRFAGKLAERTRPWFYERQRLGGIWQQAFVKSVRWLSAALALADAKALTPRRRTSAVNCQTLIIGGGPAGVLAAEALSKAGRRCLVVHAGERGGSAHKLFVDRPPPWPEPANGEQAYVELDRHLCVGLYDEARRALCIGPEGNVLVSFDDLVVATGAYDRIPTVEGNDLPGVIGLRAFERLVAQDTIPTSCRVGVFADKTEAVRAVEAARAGSLSLAFAAGPGQLPSSTAPTKPDARLHRIVGHDRVMGVAFDDGSSYACDLLVVGFTQPSYEFQAQNGCPVELIGEPPVVQAVGTGRNAMLVVGEACGWTEPANLASRVDEAIAHWLAGRPPPASGASKPRAAMAAAQRPSDAAFVCFCEDVRVGDIRAAIADGYDDVELVKRHTGAGTGPCQGKLCHASLLACMAESGSAVRIPTPRPLLRPVALRQLAGDESFVGK